MIENDQLEFAKKEEIKMMQSAVNTFLETNELFCGEQIRYIDLVSEIGELGKEIIKSTNYGKIPYSMNESTVEEMGDCLFSILALCCELKIDANKALAYALEKYRKRLDKAGSVGSGR